MTTPQNNPQNPMEERLPDALQRALRELPSAPVEVEASVDEAVREAADAHFARERSAGSGTPLYYIARRLAAAAIVLIVAGVGVTLLITSSAPPDRGSRPETVWQGDPHDLNRDGVIDIVDVMLLARAVEEGRADPELDLTGSGTVDQSDVEWLARQVVQLIDFVAKRRTEEQPG